MKILAGIQPSGNLHIGNYFGSIQKLINSQNKGKVYAFIVNYHAMTTVSDALTLSKLTVQAATDFLALGIDPLKSYFWIQSDVKEVLELYWILSSFTPMGLLERAHSYKDKVAKGIASNHSLFSYPVLMAADILLFGGDKIAVGKDQIQHVEIARDIAIKFNNAYGNILVLPEFDVDENVATIAGIDGAKMSKSYGNTINIFDTKQNQMKAIKKIVTASTPLNQAKDYNNCNIYAIAKLFLNENELKTLQKRYTTAGEGFGHFKLYLADVIWEYFKDARKKRAYYEAHEDEVRDILKVGANKVRDQACKTMELIRRKTGITY